MATKKTIAVVFVIAVVLMAFFATGEATCMDDCTSSCMQQNKGATAGDCKEGCEGYCDQTEGNSPGTDLSLP